MRAVAVIAVLVGLVALTMGYANPKYEAVLPRDGKRLIQVVNGPTKWVTEEEMFDMIRNEVHFEAVVEHPEVAQIESMLTFGVDPLPTKPVQQALVNSFNAELSPDNIKATITHLSTDFFTRYYGNEDALKVSEDIKNILSDIMSASVVPNGLWDIELMGSPTHDPQANVLLRIIPEGPAVLGSVIVGAHLDSINQYDGPSARSPGADDDGSGCGTVIEIIRVLTARPEWYSRLDRVVEFHFYAAEEVGLVGSKVVAKSYAAESTPVHAMFQLDMLGYIDPEVGEIITVNDNKGHTDPELTEFIRKLVAEYTDVHTEDINCGYGCSDHASWYAQGYRSANVFETRFNGWPLPNKNIHSADDLVETLSMEHCVNIGKVGLAFVVEMTVYDESPSVSSS